MSSNKPTKPQIEVAAVRERILCAVLDAGFTGLRISALMRMTGRSNTNVGLLLRALHLDGLVGRSHGGGNACVWGPPGTWEHHAAARMKTARSRIRQRELRAAKLAQLHHVSTVRPAHSIWDAARRGLL